MRIDTALADQLQFRQSLQQGFTNLGSLADQHQRFGIAEALRQRVDILDVIVPDRDVMAGELAETAEGAHGVEIIVENGNLHDGRFPGTKCWLRMPLSPSQP